MPLESARSGARIRVAGAVAGVVLIAALMGLLAWGLLNREAVTGRSGVTRVDKPAPPISMELLDGQRLEVPMGPGVPMLVNFWASWCPPCRDEAALLERAWRTYRGDGVLFVGVDIQDSEAEARSYVRQYDITYPNGLDTDGKITIDYGVIGLPVTFFVDSSGIVRRRWVGAIDATTLDAWLNELIRGTARQGGSEGENLERFFELERR